LLFAHGWFSHRVTGGFRTAQNLRARLGWSVQELPAEAVRVRNLHA
jgi:hypothetical protein